MRIGGGRSLEAQRAAMVADQLRARGVRDDAVLKAMGDVPRELFVPDWRREQAYADEALPIEAGQTISQPYIVARMTELLAVRPGHRVLEIGTGSGYQAAILAKLGARITTIERQSDLIPQARARLEELGLVDMVEFRVGDGSQGLPGEAPWPRIIVTAAAPQIPRTLREQLDPDSGRMVIPVGSRDRQDLLVVVRQGNEWIERSDGPCVFVPLIGSEGFHYDA